MHSRGGIIKSSYDSGADFFSKGYEFFKEQMAFALSEREGKVNNLNYICLKSNSPIQGLIKKHTRYPNQDEPLFPLQMIELAKQVY